MEVTIRDVRFLKNITSVASGWGVSMYTSRSFSDFPDRVTDQGTKGNVCYFTATGMCLPEEKGLTVDFTGRWTRSKYGDQFAVSTYTMKTPDSLEEMEQFLCSGAIKGIGVQTAKRIAAQFGTDAIRVITEEPEKLLTVKGISPSRLDKIRNSAGLKIGYQNLQGLLSPLGFRAERIMDAYKTFGEDAAQKVKQNPYILLKVRGINFAAADRAGDAFNVEPFSGNRLIAGLQAAVRSIADKNQHVYVCREALFDEAKSLLNASGKSKVNDELLDTALMRAVFENHMILRFPGIIDAVYLPEFDTAEREIAREAVRLISASAEDKKWLEEAEKWLEKAPFRLTEGQEKAVRAACSNRLLVITGGAGTGKTTIAKAIIESFRASHPDLAVTLLAPTGKAARRLSESTGQYASTIHSALRLGIGSDVQDYVAQLPGGLVVVDECSMIDIFVMQSLMSAVPDGSTVVFLGDQNQLPSVGAGAVLAELIRSEKVNVQYLTEIMRQGKDSNIIGNSLKINEGRKDLVTGSDFCFMPASIEDAQQKVLKAYLEETARFGKDNVVVLSPLRKWGQLSSVSLNKLIQQAVIDPMAANEICHGTKFCAGDRVIQTRNTENAANGEVGYLDSISTEIPEDGDTYETVFRITFESGVTVRYTKREMEDVDLAYSLTVHKSQGSEYRSVIIPLLMDYKGQLYKRNLLYTAVTRAKEKVILIGHKRAFDVCIDTADTGTRNTLLANRIYLMMQQKK